MERLNLPDAHVAWMFLVKIPHKSSNPIRISLFGTDTAPFDANPRLIGSMKLTPSDDGFADIFGFH